MTREREEKTCTLKGKGGGSLPLSACKEDERKALLI